MPADARIVYAAQGESFLAYVADLARPPGMSKEVHWLANYVMLSRGTSLESLLILRLCAREELTTGAPAFRDEVARLEELQRTSWKALQRRLAEVLPQLTPETRAVIEDLFTPTEVGRLVVEGGETDAAEIPPKPHRRLRRKTAPSRASQAPPPGVGLDDNRSVDGAGPPGKRRRLQRGSAQQAAEAADLATQSPSSPWNPACQARTAKTQ